MKSLLAIMFVCLVSLPSQTQAGEALSQADLAKINEGTDSFVKAVLAKDWAKVANLYTEEAILNPPNQPAVKGRAAIQEWMGKFPPLRDFNPG